MYVAQTTVETTSDFECGRGISFSSMVKTNHTWACIPPPLDISPVSVLFSFMDHQTQEPRWLVNEIGISKWLLLCSFLLAVLLLVLVSSLCCSLSAVKQTLKAKRRNAAVSWDELVLCLNAVYAHSQHQGQLERTLRIHYCGSLALPYFAISHKDHMLSVLVFLYLAILTILVEFSPPCLHGELLVFRLCLLSRVLTCVLPWGSRVYVQACVCPSGIWLCFNTVHELLFCGTWLAWIHFVYICTLILFTV